MSMKTILVHVEEHEGLESVLTSALLVARRFGSHIEGLHVRPGLLAGARRLPEHDLAAPCRGVDELGPVLPRPVQHLAGLMAASTSAHRRARPACGSGATSTS